MEDWIRQTRSCISDVSSDSDYGIFDERSSEDDNNFATEGVSKDFQQFIPKYIKTWIQEAKECDWDESIFVQWLRDFDETEDNLHINMRITEDSWLTTSVIDKTAEYIEAEESISIEDLLKPSREMRKMTISMRRMPSSQKVRRLQEKRKGYFLTLMRRMGSRLSLLRLLEGRRLQKRSFQLFPLTVRLPNRLRRF